MITMSPDVGERPGSGFTSMKLGAPLASRRMSNRDRSRHPSASKAAIATCSTSRRLAAETFFGGMWYATCAA